MTVEDWTEFLNTESCKQGCKCVFLFGPNNIKGMLAILAWISLDKTVFTINKNYSTVYDLYSAYISSVKDKCVDFMITFIQHVLNFLKNLYSGNALYSYDRCLLRILAGTPNILIEVFHRFPQLFHAKARCNISGHSHFHLNPYSTILEKLRSFRNVTRYLTNPNS
jgi:hypothetical protein